MFYFDSTLLLKIVAWFLQYPFYILWFIIKFILKRKDDPCDRIQAPQHPRVIVITGASQGIGEGLVEYYYKNCPSCETIVMISRSVEKLETVKNRLDSNSRKKLIIYPCDVTNANEMKRILLEVHENYGQVDIVFANAGLSFRQQSLKNTLEEAIRNTFTVNIDGVLNTILPLMECNGVRQIALVSSQAAYATFMSPIYGATKQCILSLGRDLRRMLAKNNIAVNIISPGPVNTPMLAGSFSRSVERAVSKEEAAKVTFHGLRRNQAEIVFPAKTGIVVYTLSYMPLCISMPIANFLSSQRKK